MKKTNFFTMIIAMMVYMGLAASTFAYGPNLITNGDFSNGNMGFITDYTYVAPGGSLVPEGTYAVDTEANDYHSNFQGFPAVGDNFLMVNGAKSSQIGNGNEWIVWQQEVQVEPGVEYEFSFMLSSLVTTAPADLEITIKIDDVVMQEVFLAPGEVNKWVKKSWRPMDKSETATITIYETSQIAYGNDFGIDDIQFVALCPDFEDIATVEVTDITCTGDEDGKIVLTLNGVKPFNACIMDGCDMIATQADLTPLKTSTYTFDGLLAGMYTISVMDGNGCMYSVCVEVGDPGPIEAVVDFDPIRCNGEKTDVTVTGTGGTLPYTLYNEKGEAVRTFMESSYTLTDLPAGVYNWTLADAKECTPAVIDFEIEQNPVLTARFNFDSILCFDGNTVVTVTAEGGAEGDYKLFEGETLKGTFASDIDLVVTEGTYDWTVVDVNGCEFDIQVVVVEPTQLTASYKASEILCNGGTSDVVVTVEGGTSPYTLLTGEPTPLIVAEDNLTHTVLAGTYNWTVEDANGCTFDIPAFTISEPTALNVKYSFDKPAIACFGDEIEITIVADGGTSPYQLFDGDAFVADFTGKQISRMVGDGTYNWTVKDANGCEKDVNFKLTEPAPLSYTEILTDATCFGFADGMAQITLAGGTAPFTADRSTFTGNILTITGLEKGSYDVVVTDANNCSLPIVVEIKEPERLTAEETFVPIACYDGTTSLTVIADGGEGEYKLYKLAVEEGNLLDTFTSDITLHNLSEGDYYWIVVDENGCTAVVDTTLTQPLNPLTAEVTPGTIACTDGETTALVTAAGGTAPYYLYNGATLVAEFNDSFLVKELTADTYNWTVTDKNSCDPVALTFTLINPKPIVVQVESKTDILCFDSNTGVIEVSAIGGTGDLTYAIEGMPAQDNGLFTGLYAGDYTIVVTDENGCTGTIDVELEQPDELQVVLTIDNASCDGINDGQITGMISGGVGPYSVCLLTECFFDDTKMEEANKSQGMMYWGLEPGNYMVAVMDQNGCVWMECVTVGVNKVNLTYDVVEACEVEESLVSFIYPGLENVDDDTSLASVNNHEYSTGLSSISILGGMGTVTAYSDFAAQTSGTIVHRGTRGIGIASSPDNDEISHAEGMTIEFTEPVALSAFEVRSLFLEGSPEVAEQGTAVLYLGADEVASLALIADQAEGGVGQFITTLATPLMVDKIDFYIDDAFQHFSEFALAKLLMVDVEQLVTIDLTPAYPGASSFTYLWNNNEETASLTGVEAGDYSVIVTAVDEFGAALCFEEFMISAAATCNNLTLPTLPIVNNLVGLDVMLSDDMHKATENSLRAYPNPFTNEATIEFMVTKSSEVRVEVFNLIGERVALVFEGHVNAFDTQTVSFRAESLPNGIYIYKLTAGDSVYNNRIILTR